MTGRSDDEDVEDWFVRALADETEGNRRELADDKNAAESGRPEEPSRDESGRTAPVESDSTPLFDDDFGTAFENVTFPAEQSGHSDIDADVSVQFPTGDSYGVDGYGAPEFGFGDDTGSEFEDDDVETSLPRIDLGIDGLDRMIQGGIPERSLMVAMGSAGTGKTTFGVQFLAHGLERGERGIFITLEETRQRIVDSATEKGFPFDEYVDADRLAVVDVDPVEMANSLGSIRSELPRLVEEYGASRLVLDSVSLLEMMYEDRAMRRNEIFDFTRSLKSAGVTALLTSEAAEDSPYASRYGIVEYLTDAVFVMQYIRPDDFRETRLAVEIQKIRDANHSREKKPYEITNEGISVHQEANLF